MYWRNPEQIDWQHLSQQKLADIVRYEGAAWDTEFSPYAVTWRFEWIATSTLVKAHGGGLSGWRAWYEDELCNWQRYGDDGLKQLEAAWLRDPLSVGPIIMATWPDGHIEIGDGWHRAAISVLHRVPQIPVITATIPDTFATENPIEFVDQGLSPLCAAAAPRNIDPRNLYQRSYEVFRVALVDPDAPPPPREELFVPTTRTLYTSSKTGKPFKKPRVMTLPGAAPSTIAFLDYHPYSENSLYVDYMNVRRDMRGQSLGYRLVKAFYEAFAARGITHMSWGRVMNPQAWRLLEKMQAEFPGIESTGHRRF